MTRVSFQLVSSPLNEVGTDLEQVGWGPWLAPTPMPVSPRLSSFVRSATRAGASGGAGTPGSTTRLVLVWPSLYFCIFRLLYLCFGFLYLCFCTIGLVLVWTSLDFCFFRFLYLCFWTQKRLGTNTTRRFCFVCFCAFVFAVYLSFLFFLVLLVGHYNTVKKQRILSPKHK